MSPSWQIMMCGIPHRHERMCALLAEMGKQMLPGMSASMFYDNLVVPVGVKYRVMRDASTADYLSILEDDDMVPPDWAERVMAALASKPDYVGFPVHWTHDGVQQPRVEHTLRHDHWENRKDLLLRDITQFNPMRREYWHQGALRQSNRWDFEWAAEVRRSGQVKTEVWIGDPMYLYRTLSHDTYMTRRESWPEDQILPVPEYPWLTTGPWDVPPPGRWRL